jgi:hypothetical protein
MSAGTIVFNSRNGGMVVVRHDDGYTPVEMLGDEGALVMCDIIGDWDALGGEPIYSQGNRYEAVFPRDLGFSRATNKDASRWTLMGC